MQLILGLNAVKSTLWGFFFFLEGIDSSLKNLDLREGGIIRNIELPYLQFTWYLFALGSFDFHLV